MPLEFALRPRFRLTDDVVPVRRSRLRMPRWLLPIAGYWLGIAALTHVVIITGRSEAAESPEAEFYEREPATFAPAPHEPPPIAFSPTPPASEPLAFAEPAAGFVPPYDPLADDIGSEPGRVAPPPERYSLPAAPREPTLLPRVPQPPVPPLPTLAALPIPLPDVERRAPRAFPPVERRREPAPIVVPDQPGQPAPPASSLPSCEAVLEGSSQDIDFGAARGGPDLPRESFSGVLDNGSYLGGCGVPGRTSLDICVAVQGGKVRGVSVVARPANPRVSACVSNAVARLRFPVSSRLDVARTHFDAAR
jgi:hypothetical protein